VSLKDRAPFVHLFCSKSCVLLWLMRDLGVDFTLSVK